MKNDLIIDLMLLNEERDELMNLRCIIKHD